MYNSYDNSYELAVHEKSVATHGDKICSLVKRGNFKFDTFAINSYQTIEYLLTKGAENAVENVLIDKLQDLHDKEKINFEVEIKDPVYSISSNLTSVDEGGIVTFNINTANYGSGTLYWTITGTTDVNDFNAYSGSVSIINNTGSFSVQTTLDLVTEGSETFSINLRTGSETGDIVATSNVVTINDTSLSPNPVLPTYVAPVVTESNTIIEDPLYLANTYMVGEVVTLVSQLSYSDNKGSILEPWNGNNQQDVRVGTFTTAVYKVTNIPSYANGSSGGTPVTVNQLLTTTIDGSGYEINMSQGDVEIGLGTIEYGLNAIRSVGPTPRDSQGNLQQVLTFDPLANGTYAGLTYSTTNAAPGKGSVRGYFGIYTGNGGTTLLRDTEYYNLSEFSEVPVIGYTASTYYLSFSKEVVDTKGLKLYDYYSGTTDITANAVQSTFNKLIETGLTVPYYQYAISSTHVPGGTIGFKFEL